MTWLGKILAFVVMIGAGVWAYFTVQAYVTRTNWKAELERYKTALAQSESARRTEAARHQSGEDALKRLLDLEVGRGTGLQKQVDALSGDVKKTTKDFRDLQNEYEKADVKATLQAANLKANLEELTAVRDRSSLLEDERVKLVIAREDALRDKVRAENFAKLQAAIADDYAKKIEDLTDKVLALKASGGDPRRAVLSSFDKTPPPVLPNLRGEVERVQGDLVQVGLGVDAGLSKNTVLDVVRGDNGGRYVGTIKIIDLYPKQAIGVFTPARVNVPFSKLRPEELPKKGDEVRPPEGSGGP